MSNEPGGTATQGHEPPRSMKWSWGEKPPQLYTLCALAFLAAPVGFLIPANLPILLAVIAGLTLLSNPVSGIGPIRRQIHIYPLLALSAWAGLSVLWTQAPVREAADQVLKLSLFAVLGILTVTYARELRDKDKAVLGRWLAPSVWAVLALFLFDRVTGQSLTGLWAGGDILPGSALLLLSWPAAGMLFHGSKPVQALLLLTGAGLVQAGAGGQEIILAWVAGGAAAAFAAILPRTAAVILGTVFVTATLAAPFLAGLSGIAQRLVPGAKAMADVIHGHPFLGTGFWTFDARIFHAVPNISGSTILQIWLELGLFGAVILCALTGILAAAGCKGPPATRAVKFGLLAAAFTLACLSHGAWQGGWPALLFIAGAFAAALPDRVWEK